MKKYLTYPFVVRIGLACVFLALSLTAFTAPDEATEIVSNSFWPQILPLDVSTMVNLIGINDMIVAILLFIGWRTSRVAIWATIWIIGVIFMIGVFSLDALEHLAFLSIAIALALDRRDN